MRNVRMPALLLCLCAGLAQAQEPGMQGMQQRPGMMQGQGMQNQNRMGPPRDSLERAMVHKALAESLAQRTGRKPAELAALLEQSPPPELAQQLGIDPEAMHQMVLDARRGAVQKALAAGLIGSADAQRIVRAIDQDAQSGPMMGGMNGSGAGGGMPPRQAGDQRAAGEGW